MPATETSSTERSWSALLKVVKTADEQGLVFGWLYQTETKDGAKVTDHSGDVTPIEELEPATYKYAEDSRAGTDMHERICPACDAVCALVEVRANACGSCGKSLAKAAPAQIATLIEVMCFTPEKKRAMGIPDGVLPSGTWVGLRVNLSTEKGRAAWEGVKSGRLSMLSLGGRWKRTPIKGAA